MKNLPFVVHLIIVLGERALLRIYGDRSNHAVMIDSDRSIFAIARTFLTAGEYPAGVN